MITPKERRTRVFQHAMPAVSEQILNTTVGLMDVLLVGRLPAAAARVLGYSSAIELAATGVAKVM